MRAVGFLLLLTAIDASAQRRGGGIVGGYRGQPGGHASVQANYGSRHGFGNVVFPGTGRPPGAYADPGFAGRLGATVSGYPGYTGAPIGGYRGGQNRSSYVYVPYGYPVYPYYQEPQNVTVVMQAPPPSQTPGVVINQNFVPEVVRPVVRDYTTESTPSDGIRIYESRPRAAAEPAPQEEKRSYLIAFKDHTIYAAFAYWMEGETLHYVTTHGTHNQVSLDLIDRELSERLNRERSVDFRLPRK